MQSSDEDVEDDDLDEAEFEVERLVDKRIDANGDFQYLIKWKNYPESVNSWEPISNLSCSDLIKEFEAARGKPSSKIVRKRHQSLENDLFLSSSDDEATTATSSKNTKIGKLGRRNRLDSDSSDDDSSVVRKKQRKKSVAECAVVNHVTSKTAVQMEVDNDNYASISSDDEDESSSSSITADQSVKPVVTRRILSDNRAATQATSSDETVDDNEDTRKPTEEFRLLFSKIKLQPDVVKNRLEDLDQQLEKRKASFKSHVWDANYLPSEREKAKVLINFKESVKAGDVKRVESFLMLYNSFELNLPGPTLDAVAVIKDYRQKIQTKSAKSLKKREVTGFSVSTLTPVPAKKVPSKSTPDFYPSKSSVMSKFKIPKTKKKAENENTVTKSPKSAPRSTSVSEASVQSRLQEENLPPVTCRRYWQHFRHIFSRIHLTNYSCFQVKVHFFTDDREMLKNLTAKISKTARQHGVVQDESDDEPRFLSRQPHHRFSFETMTKDGQDVPEREKQMLSKFCNNRTRDQEKIESKERFYDEAIENKQNISDSELVARMNIQAVYLFQPNSEFGDVATTKRDMLRGIIPKNLRFHSYGNLKPLTQQILQRIAGRGQKVTPEERMCRPEPEVKLWYAERMQMASISENTNFVSYSDVPPMPEGLGPQMPQGPVPLGYPVYSVQSVITDVESPPSVSSEDNTPTFAELLPVKVTGSPLENAPNSRITYMLAEESSGKFSGWDTMNKK